MDSSESIAKFFYNIVPGILFIFFLHFYKINFVSEKTDVAITIFLLIIFGLALGFVFQALTKIFRNIFDLDLISVLRVTTKDENAYNEARKELLKKNLILKNDDKKKCFYIMDNYLRGRGTVSFIVEHFSARFAFWSNIFVGTLLLITILFLNKPPDCPYEWFMAILVFSGWASMEYLRILYDSILKTFISVVKLK